MQIRAPEEELACFKYGSTLELETRRSRAFANRKLDTVLQRILFKETGGKAAEKAEFPLALPFVPQVYETSTRGPPGEAWAGPIWPSFAVKHQSCFLLCF